MLVYYYNRNGIKKLTFGEDPYFMLYGSGEFKNSTWGYDERYGNLVNFRRDKADFPFSVVITSNDMADYDKFCDVFSEDVIAGQPGYILMNGWRLDCFVVKSDHQFYGDKDMVIAFTARATNKAWTRENTTTYDGTIGGQPSDENYGRDYSYEDDVLGRGYDYGYSATDNGSGVVTLSTDGNGYEMLIYGPATNPVVYLNNYPVQVNITLTENQRLRIVSNGPDKRIELLDSADNATNAFVYRDKTHTPFIDIGERTELTYDAIRFDFTTIERRSEPTWI